MKKSLVLAMALAMGVTASAYAANPFSDVPAGHWAYDSISNLVDAGVVEGYPDGTFGGDKLMTRYEMAQIVAKAMAKGANVDRLAAEFADELDALGVRVAALEKKADNVKITGQIRWHYAKYSGDNKKANDCFGHKLRSRLTFNGQINDDWTYTALLQNIQDFKTNVGEEGTEFQRAFVKGRLGGLKVTAGRYEGFMGDGNIYDHRFDGIRVDYGKDFRLGGYFGKPATVSTEKKLFSFGRTAAEKVHYDKAWGVNAGANVGKLAVDVAYDQFFDGQLATTEKNDKGKVVVKDFQGGDAKYDKNGIFSAGLKYNFADFSLGALYLRSNIDKELIAKGADRDGFVISASYKGANKTKVGSWGLLANYYNQGAGTEIAHTMNGNAGNFRNEGFKGYEVAGYLTVAKNMVAGVEWYDLKGKESDDTDKTLWTSLIMTF